MPFFAKWTATPIPGLSLSAGGLIALADLSTIAQRTAITGGSSWLDTLLLAPGLHYQQAADSLARGSGTPALDALETEENGRVDTYQINNAATVHYIQKVARPGRYVTLDVGSIPPRYRPRKRSTAQHAAVWDENGAPGLGVASQLLYIISPLLTCCALVFMILLEDWWGLAALLGLMISRVLNVWVIKQRAKPPPHDPTRDPSHPDHSRQLQSRLTEYVVNLGDGRGGVRLRGMSDDLQAITAEAWLRGKTHVDGYLEATAKLLVYIVAALSGNLTQAGAIALMLLLLVSAGLLALSNAHAKSFRMHGRVAAPTTPDASSDGGDRSDGREEKPWPKGSPPYPHGGSDQSTGTWPPSSASGVDGLADWAEKGQVGGAVQDPYPFDNSVDYS